MSEMWFRGWPVLVQKIGVAGKSGHHGHAGRPGRRGGSAPAWKPVMAAAQAAQWAEGTAIPEILYHGTTPERAKAIQEKGFDLAKVAETSGMHGLFGNGVNLAREESMARNYAVADSISGKPTILKIHVLARKVAKEPDFLTVVREIGYMEKYENLETPGEFLRKALIDRGYDAVDYNGEVTVFDPRKIVVVT